MGGSECNEIAVTGGLVIGKPTLIMTVSSSRFGAVSPLRGTIPMAVEAEVLPDDGDLHFRPECCTVEPARTDVTRRTLFARNKMLF
jgi:hypothetical protein